MAIRRVRDRQGRALPLNEDGTVIRRSSRGSGGSGGVVGGGGGSYRSAGLSGWLFYPLKALLILFCLAEGLAGAGAFSQLHAAVFGWGYGLKELVTMFFPLILWVAASGIAVKYLWSEVDADDWPIAFYAPLIALAVLVAGGAILMLCSWAMNRWWTFLILLVVGPVLFQWMLELIEEYL